MKNTLLNRRELLSSVGAAATVAAAPWAFGASSPAITAPAALDFLVVGDWGRDGTQHQREVAMRMAKTAKKLGSRQVISVGDNFYYNGVQSTADPQWRTSFEDVYAARSLQIPWYVALGNHDYRGVPQAQVDYTQVSKRWRMPSRYFKVAGGEMGVPFLDLFIIDTSPLVHKYREDVQSVIADNVASQDVDAQVRWLDEQLTESTAPWKLVFGHHTIHSGGSAHGDTLELVTLIEPLLIKHRVQAYFNGHDHDLQHVRRNGVDYIGCGAGSEARPVQAVEGTLFCAAQSGFAAMRSGSDSLSLEFIDFTGASLYRAHIPRAPAAMEKAA